MHVQSCGTLFCQSKPIVLLAVAVVVARAPYFIGILNNDKDDGNKKGKKAAIGLDWYNFAACITPFGTFLRRGQSTTATWDFQILRFVEDVDKTTIFFFFLWGPLEFNSWKITNIWQILKRVGIRATNLETVRINFLSDVLSAVAVIVA